MTFNSRLVFALTLVLLGQATLGFALIGRDGLAALACVAAMLAALTLPAKL